MKRGGTVPYESHEKCKVPENLNARIWRFMDLPKLLDLLYTGRLYFCRADCFEDPYEGMMTDEFAQAVKSGASGLDFVTANAGLAESRSDFYVSSWHLSEHEPAGFWKIYGGTDGGVAICSTFVRLQHALDHSSERFYAGKVEYPGDLYGRFNVFSFIMSKRRSFEHEREVRGLIWRPDMLGRARNVDADNRVYPMPIVAPDTPSGIKIEVRLSDLITSVVVSPTSPRWLAGVLADIVKKYGYNFPVRQSDLYRLAYLPGGRH
jgi:hypothetical protein